MNNRLFFSPIFLTGLVCLVYLFLYIPICLLVIFSFNSDAISYQWMGFTTQWYSDLFASSEVFDALKNSIMVASAAVCLSVFMAAAIVFYTAHTKNSRWLSLFYLNLGVPEIVLSVGLLSFFYFFSLPLGITTLIAGHTVLGLGYAIPIIKARFDAIDQRLLEASLDLGATPMQTFARIVLPLLMPAIIASSLLVFIISFDDFILSFFCAGASTQTLPLYIFSMIRTGASPVVNALSTLLLVTSSILVLIFSSLQLKKGV